MQQPLILAVETSGRTGSVALASGEKLLEETRFSAPLRHSAEIFPAIKNLLSKFGKKPEHIEQIYISVGPGSFTGLRIAVTIAKMMNLANSVKIIAVDTLDAITANIDSTMRQKNDIRRTAAILDAKRGMFFVAAYKFENNRWEKILPDCLMTAKQFTDRFSDGKEPIWLLGEGLVYYRDLFKTADIRFLDEDYWAPAASKIHLLGWERAIAGVFADPISLQPAYLHRPEIVAKTFGKK